LADGFSRSRPARDDDALGFLLMFLNVQRCALAVGRQLR
jgi:hypothetical protein